MIFTAISWVFPSLRILNWQILICSISKYVTYLRSSGRPDGLCFSLATEPPCPAVPPPGRPTVGTGGILITTLVMTGAVLTANLLE